MLAAGFSLELQFIQFFLEATDFGQYSRYNSARRPPGCSRRSLGRERSAFKSLGHRFHRNAGHVHGSARHERGERLASAHRRKSFSQRG